MSSPAETIPSIPRTFLTSGCKPSTELAGNTCTPLFQCTNCTNCIWSSTCIWFEDVSRKHAVCILTAYTGSRDMLQTSICLDLWKLFLIGFVCFSFCTSKFWPLIHPLCWRGRNCNNSLGPVEHPKPWNIEISIRNVPMLSWAQKRHLNVFYSVLQ